MTENFTKVERENGPYDLWDKCLKESENIELEYKLINGEKKHLAPNGEVSKLPELYAKVVRTPSFLNWFGDWTKEDQSDVSKVVYAETGEPMIVYHGTNILINPEQGLIPTNLIDDSDEKLFFSKDYDKAQFFSKKTSRSHFAKEIQLDAPQIFCTFLKIVNPETRSSVFTFLNNEINKDVYDGVVISNEDYVIFEKGNILQLPTPKKLSD